MWPPPEPLGELELPHAATTTATAMPVSRRFVARVCGIRAMAVGDTVNLRQWPVDGPSPILAGGCSAGADYVNGSGVSPILHAIIDARDARHLSAPPAGSHASLRGSGRTAR